MAASACFGTLVWLVLVWLSLHGELALWVIERLFLLAPLVLVPLALDLIGETPPSIQRSQPWCALAAAAAFVLPGGPAAAALAGAWLAFTVLLAVHGLTRLRRRGLLPASELALDAALLLVPVGGGWLVASRLGATPLGFEEPIVLLTAVHFHYAAFVALVLTGLVGRALGPSALHDWIAACAVGGTSLVATGFLLSPVLGLLGTAILAAAFMTLGILMLSRLGPRLRGAERLLLIVSAASILFAMPLALVWAYGSATGHGTVTLSSMARFHGTAHALGFSLCGLLALTLAETRNRAGRFR